MGKDGSHLPTFVVVSVAIGIVALPKQLQVLLIAQGFTVGKADMAGQDLLQMFMASLHSAFQLSIYSLSHTEPPSSGGTSRDRSVWSMKRCC